MNRQILIVEDDLAVRDSMAEFVTMTGFDCQVASSAEEAIAILKTEEFQIVITDIMMPGMNGLELTDIIKKDYDIDVIVMTGYSAQYSYEEAIGKGASDFVFKPIRFQELLLRLKRVFKERELRLERNRMMADLQKLAITDSLTQLYNSRHFFTQLKMEIERANRYGHSLALLLLDIDFFKLYNDTYGHLEGDKVLGTVGQMIKTCLRTMDTAYRYGGEEFTIILPYTDGNEAKTVADRIQYALEFITFCPDKDPSIRVTLSIGVTEYFPGEELTAFVSRSDRAMYVSKESGRNRVSFLPPDEAS
jgi:two-component system, cell cycle response regulator